MKPVSIRVVSVAKNSGEQPLEQLYQGKLAEKDGKTYVFYEENESSGMAGTKTTLKWDKERLLVLRSGAVEHRQEFCQGFTDYSLYKTPQLTISLQTATTYFYALKREDAWRLDVEYKLAHDGQDYGTMQIIIEIEEDQQGGH